MKLHGYIILLFIMLETMIDLVNDFDVAKVRLEGKLKFFDKEAMTLVKI